MKLLLLDTPEILEQAAYWLASKENYKWLDFGNGRQLVTPALLKIIARGLRIRGTVGPESVRADGFQIVGVPNFVIDHVSIDQWGDGSLASGNYSPSGININAIGNRATPFPANVLTTTDATTAAHQVVFQAGARGPNFSLDSTDLNYIGQISLKPL